MPVQLTCDHCGKQFSVPPSRAKNCKTHYCSMDCMKAAHVGENNPNWKGGLIVGACLVCGEETRVKPSHVEKGEGKFCSRKCASQWVSQNALGYDPDVRIKKQCVVCGKDIFVKPSHVDYEGTYCSRECMATNYRTALRGAANPNYRHGVAWTPQWISEHAKAWRTRNPQKIRVFNGQSNARARGAVGKYTLPDIKSLMRQQDGKCVLCQCDIRNDYQVDHRIPISRGGSNYVGNLQLLCPKCNARKRSRFMVELRYESKRKEA